MGKVKPETTVPDIFGASTPTILIYFKVCYYWIYQDCELYESIETLKIVSGRLTI